MGKTRENKLQTKTVNEMPGKEEKKLNKKNQKTESRQDAWSRHKHTSWTLWLLLLQTEF